MTTNPRGLAHVILAAAGALTAPLTSLFETRTVTSLSQRSSRKLNSRQRRRLAYKAKQKRRGV